MIEEETQTQTTDAAETDGADESKAADVEKTAETSAEDKAQGDQSAEGGDQSDKKATDDSSDDGDFLKVDQDDEAEDDEGDNKEGESKADGAPEEYEKPSIPDGLEFDEALWSALSPTFKEIGLRNEQVDRLVVSFAKQVEAQAVEARAEQDRQHAEQEAKFKAELKEHFGDQYSEKSAAVGRVFRRYDPDGEVAQFFKETGLSNFPPLMKMLAQVGNVLSEGGHLESASPSKDQAPKTPHQQLWGKK